MTSTPNCLILALIFATALLGLACGAGQENSNTSANANTAQADSNSTKTNVEELGMLINVPYESEEVFWRDDAKHKKIVAVLRFSQPEANRLIVDAEKVRPPQQVNINPESWFPPELVAQSETSGDDTLSGKAYAANAFFQDTYSEGRIIKIEDSDYFILELSSK
jgi:hypothetical protein